MLWHADTQLSKHTADCYKFQYIYRLLLKLSVKC